MTEWKILELCSFPLPLPLPTPETETETETVTIARPPVAYMQEDSHWAEVAKFSPKLEHDETSIEGSTSIQR